MFTPRVINQYYGITTDDVHPLPTIQDMGEVARFLYGRDDAWPLPRRDFEHSELTNSLLILNLFVSHNIDPTTHRTTINDARARLLYHLAHGRKIDLENYIYTLISMLGFQTDKSRASIEGKGPINRHALENARRHTTRTVVGTAPATQNQPPEEYAAAPQPATPPADIASILRQILEGQAEHTRLIIATRTEMRTMQ
ncbi:Uncharacterized protein Adt_39962 [Abeliophyllum distichum]|uniref:Uncharacterized protein n=1 Tax=Abeliophyllum distichum TaxID=126358 RepID=A0ABD1Q6M7_9LAMI